MAVAPVPPRIPDNRTPLLDSGGRITTPWYLALVNLVAFVLQLAPTYLQNSHAKRLATSAASYPDGTIFFETDRLVYYVARGSAWKWYSGQMSVTQDSIPTDLGANDAGFLLFVSDYAHLLTWTGSGWTWAPAEMGSDMVMSFVTGPNPNTGWQVCDGSVVQVLASDGSLSTATTPALTPTDFYRQ